MIPILNERNGRRQRDGRGERERGKTKKQKMSERAVN
jgi:hypothetical protein